MAVKLERMPVCVPKELPEQTDAFAEKVEKQLGYRQLRQRNGTDTLRHKVLAVLASLNMAPLKPDLVAKYLRSKGSAWANGGGGLVCAVLSFFAIVVGGAATIAIAITVKTGWAATIAVAPLLGIAGLCYICCASSWRWRRESLMEYGEPVPRFALATACEVQDAMKKAGIPARFVVEFLRYEPERSAWETGDPFLVMVVDAPSGAQDFYLEVWSEPGFDLDREI